ncbi:hypothetical protein Tco_0883365 [Tanacetum coccineum]
MIALRGVGLPMLILVAMIIGLPSYEGSVSCYKLQQDDLEGVMEIEHKPGSFGAIEEGHRQPKARAPAYSGNGGIGGSKFGVGEGKVESMGGIGGGAFAIRSIMSKDGRDGGGLMASGDVSLDGWVGAGGGEVKDGGVDLGVVNKSLLTGFLLKSIAPLLSQRTETYSASVVEIAKAVCFFENHDVRQQPTKVGFSTFEKLIRSFSEERSNKNSIKVLFLRSTTPFDCGVRGAEKLCVMPLASQKAPNCTSLSNSRP